MQRELQIARGFEMSPTELLALWSNFFFTHIIHVLRLFLVIYPCLTLFLKYSLLKTQGFWQMLGQRGVEFIVKSRCSSVASISGMFFTA